MTDFLILNDEDELDLKEYNQAMEEFKSNPITYSLEEVEKELGIN